MPNVHLLDEYINEKELVQEAGPLRVFYLEEPNWSDRHCETLEVKGL